MQKTILITGSTDGIGLETAKLLLSRGHHVVLHGRNPTKLADAEKSLSMLPSKGIIETVVADLSCVTDVAELAETVIEKYARLDVLINNAGIFRVSDPITAEGLDVRFAVNTIAPYLLTKKLLSSLDNLSRVVNVSSAAQSPVNIDALTGNLQLSDDFSAYAQSKLAITSWSHYLANSPSSRSTAIIAVNPGSMLGSKMVKEGFGVAGGDIGIGADILTRAALDESFGEASGQYFDNDARQFAQPHPDAEDDEKSAMLIKTLDQIIASTLTHL